MAGGVLGIVGGLGPEATVFYYREAVRLHREWWGSDPRLVIYSVPIDEMCRAAKARDIDAVASLLLEALRALAGAGASVAIVSANTPHMAWSRIVGPAGELGLRLVSIFDPAAEELTRRGASRVGILATRATLEAGFYQEALTKRGMRTVDLPPDVQDEVDKAIEAIATRGTERGLLERIARAARILAEGGADHMLIACTDLSPYTRKLEEVSGLPIVDSSAEHVKAALRLVGPR